MVCGPLFVLLPRALQMLGAGVLKAVLGDSLFEMNSNGWQTVTHI